MSDAPILVSIVIENNVNTDTDPESEQAVMVIIKI